MRPTDENQHGSTRPNLMSPSRQGGGEDNILAMLERDAGRGRASQFASPPRMAWYACAGTLVVAMVGALGWLAWENATKARELPLATAHALPPADTRVVDAQGAPAAPAAAPVQAEPPLPAAPVTASVQFEQPLPAAPAAALVQPDPAVPPTAGAAIIDSPVAPAEAPVLLAQAANGAPAPSVPPSTLPPLVLLPPEEAKPKRTPAAPATARSRPAPAVPPKADAAHPSRPVAKADAAHGSRPAAKADAAPGPRTAAKTPPRRPARPVVARAKKAPAPATPAAPAKSPDAAADSDVALISAIIMHSSKHAAERAKAEAAKSCDGGKCPAKPAARQ